MSNPTKTAVARKASTAASTADRSADTARKTTARSKPAAASKTDAPVEPAESAKREAPRAKNILSAGIKALANAHGEAVARQSRVFESLLGLGQTHDAKAAPGAALDPFGFKKFEDVFDQRVARTLQRLEVPSAQAFAELTAEVERLRDEVARLGSQVKKR